MTPSNSSFFTKDVEASKRSVSFLQAGRWYARGLVPRLGQMLGEKWLYCMFGVSLGGLFGCAGDRLMPSDWAHYENPRYDFVFPYPDTWIAAPVGDKRHGQAFADPNFEAVQMIGWASEASVLTNGNGANPNALSLSPNFVTEQGIPAQLEVEIGADMSVMTLRLSQDGVLYYWEGRSPSGSFDDYYQFFYYVAQHYRIDSSQDESE